MRKIMTKNKFVVKTMPILLGLLALIACNTTNDTKPIQTSAISQLKIKWTDKNVKTAPWFSINDITWKPDGSKIAVADLNRTYLTPLDTNPVFQTIENLSSGIAWQQDGQQIVGNSGSGFLVVNPDTGNQFAIQRGGWFGTSEPVNWSPDGRYIIGIQPQYFGVGQLIVADTTTRQVIKNLGSQNQIFALSYNSTGDKVLVVSLGRGLYDATTFNKIFSFPDGEVPVAGDFSPNGNQYAIAYFNSLPDNTINYRIAIHNTQTGEIEKNITLSKLPTSLKWNPSGTRIGSGFTDGKISIWDVNTGNVAQELPSQNSRIIDFEWHPSGSPIAVASDQTLVFFNATTGDEEGRMAPSSTPNPNANQRTNNVYGLAYNSNGTELLEVGRDTKNVIRKASDGTIMKRFTSHEDSVYGVAYSPDGTEFITASADGTAIISDQATKTPIGTLSGHAYTLRGVAWNNSGTRIATASWDSTAKLWNPDTSEEIATIQHTDFVNAVAFNPTSTQVATGSSDRTLKISSSTDGTLIRSIDTPAAILSLAWNSSGTQISIGATDKNVYVYDSTIGALLKTLTGHIGAVRAVLWNKDDTAIISGGDDGNVKLWDVQTNTEITSVKPAGGFAVFALALSPNGTTVVAGTANGTTVAYTLQ
jgi:WD40 repeat protein